MIRSTRIALRDSCGVSTTPLTKHFSGAPHRLLAGFTPENSSPSHLGGGSNKKSPNHKDFLVPPNAILKCTHTMLSIPQISTKLERERKGRRWTSISYPHPQRDLNISYKSWLKPWERERRG